MRAILPIAALLVLLIIMFAIDRPAKRAELTTAVIPIKTLDGQLMQAMEDIRVGYALYEGLVTFDPYNFATIPGVASDWEVSEDQLVYTFHLRPEAKWSDGTPLTAEDFRYTWRVGLMPDTAPVYIDFLFHLKGGREFFDWCSAELKAVNEIVDPKERRTAARRRIEQSVRKFDELVGVEVVDAHTLRVSPARFTPYFIELLACWPYYPLPKHILENVSSIDPTTHMLRRDQQWTKPGNDPPTMITNGPYRLTRWLFKREMFFEANEHYWNAEAVQAKTIRILPVPTHKVMFDTYSSGALDVMFGADAYKGLASELIRAQRQGERNDVHEFDAFGNYYYVYNNRPRLPDGSRNPFADARVRKAFSLVVDKQAIVERVTRLNQRVASVFIPPGAIAGYESPAGFKSLSDAKTPAERAAIIDEAKALLAEAGYPDGKGFPRVDVSFNTGSGHDDVAQALGNMWSENLGLNINLNAQEWKVFLTNRTEGRFMIARSGWFGDYLDPTTFLDLLRTGNGNNDGGFSDEKFDAMLAEAEVTLDPAKRMAILSEAERYMIEDQQPILPLYYYKMIHLYDESKVQGVSLHPRNLQMLYRIGVQD